MQPLRVAHPADPRVALYRGVRDPELLRDHGVFIAEGRLVVQRLLQQSRFSVRSVLVTPAALDALRDELTSAPADVLVVEQDVMDAIASFNIHRGCLALADRPRAIELRDLLATRGPLLVLEHIGNPDNIGAAFRNAGALGASGVLLSPGCTDPLYRKAIRTSMGASLRVPFAILDSWPEPLEVMRDAGWDTIALATDAEADVATVLSSRPSAAGVAFVLGHEGTGLSEAARCACTRHAHIPMAPGADSLNVATAAAIALYALR